jgi:hypothetical protein
MPTIVIIFEKKRDAERVMAVIPKRFEKYGLTVIPIRQNLLISEVQIIMNAAVKI